MIVHVHRVGEKPRRLTQSDTLTAEPLLPGFNLPLLRVFTNL